MIGKNHLVANPNEDYINLNPKDCIVVVSNHSKATDEVELNKFWLHLESAELGLNVNFIKVKHILQQFIP